MAKLLVKDPKTGNPRPMTQKSFDMAGKKRGFVIIGKEAETGAKSEIEQHMDRLRAEKAAKEAQNESGLAHPPVIDNADDADSASDDDQPKERKKPGPKPKNPAA